MNLLKIPFHELRKAEAKSRFNIKSNNITCNLYYKQSANFQIYRVLHIEKKISNKVTGISGESDQRFNK